MGNKWKGTFEVEILGETYTLRPSFDAMCEFEEKTGFAVPEAHKMMGDGKTSFKIVAAAVWAGIKGESYARQDSKMCPSFSVIGEKMRREGIQNCAVYAMQFLSYGLIPEDALKEMSEAEESEKKPKPTDE